MANTRAISRRHALLAPLGLAGLAGLASATPERANAEPAVNDDGLHVEPWFHESFLDLKDDVAEAAAAGKNVVIFWEQRGCPYCAEMHKVNLARPEISSYIQENFLALQLNLYGSRIVTDFDGTELEERKLAERWRVNFTPTLNFFPADVAAVDGKNGRDAEAWRLQGYWKPFHFHATFVYVKTGAYKHEPNFQRWLGEYREKLRAEGKNVDLW